MTRGEELALKRHRHGYFLTWSYLCFRFRRKIYGSRVNKWFTQCILVMFGILKLLAFAPLLNTKKHVFNYSHFKRKIVFVCFFSRRHRREQRARGRRREDFFHKYSFILNARRTHYLNISFAKSCYFTFTTLNTQLWVTQYQLYQNF